jgi:AcrR family transcriptional regulator
MNKTAKPRKIGRPSGSSREQTLEKILASSLKLFSNKGFAATRLKDIAEDIGVTTPTLYKYFESKVPIYGAIFDSIYVDLIPKFEIAIGNSQTLREQLRGLLQVTMELHSNNPDITMFMATAAIETRRHEELATYFANRSSRFNLALQRMFDAAKARGEISHELETGNLISTFLGGIMGMSIAYQGIPGASLEKSVDVFIALMENSFFEGS